MLATETRPGIDLPTVFWFVHHGFSVIPCHLGSKVPKIKWTLYKTQLPTEDELTRWFRIPCNGAVVTGTNNLVVIDFDDVSEYVRWSQWAAIEGSGTAKMVLHDAYKVRTARGLHVYTRCVEDMRNLHFGKIDIKGKGGLVTIPGSIHPSGAVYTVYQDGGFPTWHSLTELFPEEMLKLAERAAAPVRKVNWEVVDRTPAQVLDMKIGVNIEEVKKAHRIEDYLGEILFTGEHWGLTLCPFHEDNNPSFWVDTERQLCGCFSGCTAKPLDVVNLFARLNNLSNTDALRILGGR